MAPSDNTTTIPDTSAQLLSLVNQAREGNRSALTQLADRFQQDIFRMVFYRIRSRVDAEDITQDVFLKAFQKISSVKDAAKFRGWLFSIALNRIRDFQRKKRFRSLFKNEDENIESHPIEKADSDQPEALEQVLRKDFWRQIGLILKKLPTMEREVFLLRFFDHLSIKEIAGVLKKNESTVKTHLYRALAKFKKEPAMRQLLNEVNQ
ncbi:RNA polymerase sigma-54 factor RpoN [Olavius sp. associated proteobacterium Delta 1]|nr:RNA polymerase sigma-54 factor RpoN [Olavius sp. associated proteobacterium Delta 1]